MEIIYDYETLSEDQFVAPVVCVAGIEFDSERFVDNPYTWEELLDITKFQKYNVQEQVEKYGRKIRKFTLDWWKRQEPEVQELLKPSDEDVSVDELYNFLCDELNMVTAKKVWTRGNTFDPIVTLSMFNATGHKDRTPWWTIRDVRSYIEGFTYGTDIKHYFVPKDVEDKFKQHDPRHDVAMDVYRMQFLINTMYGKD